MWEKIFFIITGFWAKIFYLFSIKVREGFQNCILRVQGKILRKIIVCFGKQKIFFVFFCFSSQNLSEFLLKLHSECPEGPFQGKMLLKTPQICLSFLRLEANHFWIFGKPFSIKMSKLLFMWPNKCIVEKSSFISSKIWEKYSGISGKKRDLHSVFSKTALSVWRESLTEVPSDFFQFSAGSTKWTLALLRKFSSKKTFHEKNNFTVFGRWPNCIYVSRGRFCLEMQFWIIFIRAWIWAKIF